MENSTNVSRNLEVAATALVGERGVQMIAELARLLDEAEARGQVLSSAEWTAAYKRGYDAAMKDCTWIDWPPEADLRDPIVNAHVEGAPFTDMSELHVQADNRSPMSDAEAYEALDRLYDDVDPEARD